MLTTFSLSTALAFEVQKMPTGEEMRWGQMPVSYAWAGGAVPTLSGVEDAIDESFTAWGDVTDAYVSIDERTTQLAPVVALDDENLVFFTEDWPKGNEALAITTTWTDDTGAIVQYDIHINASIAWSTTNEPDAYDLQAAITHEVGHVLGLGHTDVADATMFAKHEPADVHRRELHADDIHATRYLYDEPPAEPEDTGTFEPAPGGLGCRVGPGAPTRTTLAGLLLLTLLRRRGDAR